MDPRRNRDLTMPAGRVLVVVVVALLIAALFNSEAIVRAGEGMEQGTTRSIVLSVGRPLDDVAGTVGFHLPRKGLDLAFGQEDKTAEGTELETGSAAVGRRRPEGRPVHHSDQGSQYTSLIFTQRSRSVDIDVSMGSKGDCFDNAAMESFHASLRKDLIHRRSWPTKAQARTAVFGYIETFFRGRDRRCRRPPAQIPACAANALGS